MLNWIIENKNELKVDELLYWKPLNNERGDRYNNIIINADNNKAYIDSNK